MRREDSDDDCRRETIGCRELTSTRDDWGLVFMATAVAVKLVANETGTDAGSGSERSLDGTPTRAGLNEIERRGRTLVGIRPKLGMYS